MAVAGGIKCLKYLMFVFTFLFWVGGLYSSYSMLLLCLCVCEGKRDSIKRWKNNFLNYRFAPFWLLLSSATFLYPTDDKEDDNITVTQQKCTSMQGDISQWNTHAHDLWVQQPCCR